MSGRNYQYPHFDNDHGCFVFCRLGCLPTRLTVKVETKTVASPRALDRDTVPKEPLLRTAWGFERDGGGRGGTKRPDETKAAANPKLIIRNGRR